MSENLISAQTPVLSGSREKLAKAIDAQLSAFDTAMASLGQRVEALKKVKANISVMTASQNYEALLDGHEGLDANKLNRREHHLDRHHLGDIANDAANKRNGNVKPHVGLEISDCLIEHDTGP